MSLFIIFFISLIFGALPGYDKSVNSFYKTSEEQKALIVAESFDYGKLLNTSEVRGKYPDLFMNYINNDSINVINTFEKQNEFTSHLVLNYTTFVYDFASVRIFKYFGNSYYTLSNRSNYEINYNFRFSVSYNSLFIYNSTNFNFTKQINDFNRTYSYSGYVVDMGLRLATPTATSWIIQTVIIDSTYSIQAIFFGANYAIA